jgi:fatty-acid desaturase
MQSFLKTLTIKLPRTKKTYLTFFGISHLFFFAYCYFFGIWYLIISFLIGLTIFNLSAELFMHRTIAHQQFKFSKRINELFCILFSMCNFGSVAANSAIHINHHRFIDTNKDPHNFRYVGVLNTIFKNWNDEHPPSPKLTLKFMRDDVVKKQHYNHMQYSVISTILFPFIPVISFWMINLLFIISHLGKQNPYSAINLRLLFPLMWGAEMHKDHHDFPTKKKMHTYDIIYYIGNFLQINYD